MFRRFVTHSLANAPVLSCQPQTTVHPDVRNSTTVPNDKCGVTAACAGPEELLPSAVQMTSYSILSHRIFVHRGDASFPSLQTDIQRSSWRGCDNPGGHYTVQRRKWISQTHRVKVTHYQSHKLLQFSGLRIPFNRLSRVRRQIAKSYPLAVYNTNTDINLKTLINSRTGRSQL